VRLLLVQHTSGPDPGANRAALIRVLDAALDGTRPTPDLVVLPEATQADFGTGERDLATVAERLDGPFVAALADVASRWATTVVAGMFEARDDGPPYNTLVAVAPDGSVAAHYRKAHLYDAFGYRESDRLSAGPAAPATLTLPTVPDVVVGLMTCYDLRFPEQARAVVDAGAHLLLVPAAWLDGEHKTAHWLALLRARAIENTVYVAGVGKAGPRYCGSSVLVDPMGVAVAGPLDEHTDSAVPAQLSADRVRDVRLLNPSLANRRWQVVPR
jgi:predicted amidohydrolase